jgi:hypothetical protein
MRRLLAVCLAAAGIATSAEPLRAGDAPPPVVRLAGAPYELGRQHGEQLRGAVRQQIAETLRYFRDYLKVPLVRTMALNWWLDTSWRRAWPFLEPDYRDELRGLADGSGVPLADVHRLHAIPDRTYSCANFAAWGRATAGGRLIHSRNLDWNIRAGIQRHAVVFVVRPSGKQAFVSAAWAGFAGVLSGINASQVSIGQVGAETTDVASRGEPMVFLMRRVMEQASTVDEAAEIIRTASRTVGVNYVVAGAKQRRALAIETTHSRVKVFTADDPAEHGVSYARPMTDAVLRADPAMDPEIRDRQLASRGDPKRPGLEPPHGSSAYDVRYLGQAAGLQAHYGTLDGPAAQDIARKVAPGSNVQSVIFAWPDLWVANAKDLTPAAQQPYHHFDLRELFQQPEAQ